MPRTTDPAIQLADITDFVTDVFEQFCGLNNAQSMSLGADKHGSLVWEAGRTDTLHRYISLALSEVGSLERPSYLAEVRIGADNGMRFAARPSAQWPFKFRQEAQYRREITIKPHEGWRVTRKETESAVVPGGRLVPALIEGWRQALAIREAELIDEYISPRAAIGKARRHTADG